METAFSIDRRVLPCEQCGRAIDIPPDGSASCAACSWNATVSPRPDTAITAGAVFAPGDREREQRIIASTELQTLATDAGRGNLEPVRTAWTAARAEASEQAANAEAEVRLMKLTTLLTNAALASDDDLGLRAWLEAALEAARAPGHRQALRCQLARQAARAGDVASADAWLAGCVEAPDDPDAAGAYRVTRAYLATARGEWRAVLDAIGADAALPASLAGLATVLRANALEHTGDLDAASAELARAAGSLAERVSQVATIRNLAGTWNACAHSLEREVRRRALERIRLGRRNAYIAIPVALLLAALAIVVLEAGSPWIAATFGAATAIVALAGVVDRRWNRRMQQIARDGQLCHARVVRDDWETVTGLRKQSGIGGTRLWRFRIELMPPPPDGRETYLAPYLTTAEARWLSGRVAPVLWSQAHPGEAVLAA